MRAAVIEPLAKKEAAAVEPPARQRRRGAVEPLADAKAAVALSTERRWRR